MDIEREKIDFDVLFVGGGPASLAGAIRLMQLARKKNISLEVALIEKGADIGVLVTEAMPANMERMGLLEIFAHKRKVG